MLNIKGHRRLLRPCPDPPQERGKGDRLLPLQDQEPRPVKVVRRSGPAVPEAVAVLLLSCHGGRGRVRWAAVRDPGAGGQEEVPRQVRGEEGQGGERVKGEDLGCQMMF